MKKNVQLLCFSVARSLAVDLEDAAASDVAISFAATATEVLTATADPALRFVPDFLLTIFLVTRVGLTKWQTRQSA